MNGSFDARQVCLNGHTITTRMYTGADAKDFCPDCGSRTISKCQSCDEEIQGRFVAGRRSSRPVPFFNKLESVRPKLPSPNPPAFCQHCGKPYPWTEKKIEAVDELAQELEGLSPDEREILKTAIHDLIQQGPHQEVAEIRFKKIMKKVGEEGAALTRATLQGLLKDVVFKSLFGG